jgi:hypothetical protein
MVGRHLEGNGHGLNRDAVLAFVLGGMRKTMKNLRKVGVPADLLTKHLFMPTAW